MLKSNQGCIGEQEILIYLRKMGIKNIYERFIWFDDRVRQKKYPNTTSLSKEFEVSVKTAQRDIEFMRDRLNCPLQYDASLKGYFYEDETFSLPLIYLSSGELLSLMVAKKLLEDMSGSCMADEITSVVDKITSIIQKHSSGTTTMDEVLSFHLIEYSPTPEEIFRTVLEACIKKKALSFNYRSPARDEITERRVDPYHLFNYMGTWHLIGYCHMRNDIRTFKINRIRNPKILRDSFAVRKNFSFKEYFFSSFGLYKGEEPVGVKIRFAPETSKWVDDHIWHKDQKTRILEDGSLELSFPVAEFSEIAREIMKHGSGVEVIEPESLRQLIKSEAEKILKIYQ
jgi:predicted DNA-binding transcriptional regulator YafY